MIQIECNGKTYKINKAKLINVLNRLNNEYIDESNIEEFLEKFKLYDEYFLENINKL